MADTAQVWLIRTKDHDPAPLLAVLDPVESRRAAALSGATRDGFVIAHGMTRLMIGAHLGVPPESLCWRYGRYGKPELVDGPPVNLSHSGGLVLLGCSAHRPIGVDVQGVVSGSTPIRLADRYFSRAEADWVAAGADPADRFGRLWVAKEARVKAAGGRLMDGMRMARPDAVRELVAPQGFHAAVALLGPAEFQVVVHSRPEPAASTGSASQAVVSAGRAGAAARTT